MKRLLIIGLLVLVLGMVVTPGAEAHDLPDCDTEDTTCHHAWVKHTATELDPRNWPCTCDPQPDPW